MPNNPRNAGKSPIKQAGQALPRRPPNIPSAAKPPALFNLLISLNFIITRLILIETNRAIKIIEKITKFPILVEVRISLDFEMSLTKKLRTRYPRKNIRK